MTSMFGTDYAEHRYLIKQSIIEVTHSYLHWQLRLVSVRLG